MSIRRHFGNRLRLGYMALLLVVVALFWASTKAIIWFQENLAGVPAARPVIREYREISRLITQETESLRARPLGPGASQSDEQSQARARGLRESLSRLRQIMSASPSGGQEGAEEGVLETFSELDRLIERFILASASINQALDEQRTDDAMARWEQLRTSEIHAELGRLLGETIEQLDSQVRAVHATARERAEFMVSMVPIILPLFVLTSLLLVERFSRKFRLSMTELQKAAGELAEGQYKQQLSPSRYEEFERLSEALNTMAYKLLEYRENLKKTAERLEKMVEERTRALRISNKKLAMADAERRKLLADISHEFRTPLTVIRGESDILLRKPAKTEEDYRLAIERILEQANLASRLVGDLLFIARADAGELRLERSSVPIVPLLESVCDQFEAAAREKGVIIQRFTRGIQSRVYGDSGRLRQVITILIENALRYSNSRGQIDVTAWVEDEKVGISVRDYGIGLTEEDAQHAFDRFYRGVRAEKHAKGTGLGLPVAKAIVEAHNGLISLEGTPGAGAVATIFLPTRSQFRDVA